LRARQRETSPMMWAALYQQRPAPEEGDYFKSAWLRPYEVAPAKETLRVYGGSDYAVTADGGDFTVHFVVGIDPEGKMYLLDRWRKQSSSDEWIEAFCDLVQEFGSRWAGLKRRVRSAPALDLLLIGAKESERPFAIASNFRHEAIRRLELSPFEDAWRSRDSLCR